MEKYIRQSNQEQLNQGFGSIWYWINNVEQSEASADNKGNYKSERYLNLQFDLDKNIEKMRKFINMAESTASNVQVLLRMLDGERKIRSKINEGALQQNLRVCNLAKNEQRDSCHSANSDSSPQLDTKSISKNKGKYE